MNRKETITKLETIDAENLISMPLPTNTFTVDNLISQGLHLLVGDPKIGKSWLTLWLCLQVAKGEPVWTFPVRQGTVLYLCLEDNFQRVQRRLFEITEDAPDNLHLACMALDISRGLVPQLELFMQEHPDTVLVAVDTLQKIRGVATDNAGAYASDYRELSILKEFADKHAVSILLVHHTSKRPSEKDNPFIRVSGTTAIMGAADGVMVLSKQAAFDKQAVLAVTGRDIESRLLTVTQNENQVWMLLEDDTGEQLQKKLVPPVIQIVCDFVLRCGSWSGTASELAALLEPEIGETILPQSLTGKINQYHHLLQEQGIEYTTSRTASKRILSLCYEGQKPLLEIRAGKDVSTTCRGQAS